MSYNTLTNIDPTTLLLKGEDVKRSFEKEWILRLFAKHKDLPQSDVVEFLHKSQLTGANPILGQIYLIERNVKVSKYGQPDKWEKRGTVVYSYHFVTAKANETGEYEGYTSKTEVVDRFDPFAQDQNKQFKKELCATVVVKRNGKEFPYTAWWSEYAQDNAQWRSKPYVMLEKCAFAGAMRRAFPEALSGIYIEDEMTDKDIEADIEAKQKREAIEAQADKVEEIKERIEQKLQSAENVEVIEATLELIKSTMADLTKGETVAKKGAAMKELLGVSKFEELKTKSLEELHAKLKTVQATLQEKIDRAGQLASTEGSRAVKNDKHTFTIPTEEAK